MIDANITDEQLLKLTDEELARSFAATAFLSLILPDKFSSFRKRLVAEMNRRYPDSKKVTVGEILKEEMQKKGPYLKLDTHEALCHRCGKKTHGRVGDKAMCIRCYYGLSQETEKGNDG